MNVQQLIEKYKKLEGVWDAEGAELARQIFLQDLEQLDEPKSGHADEAPRYVKNVLARLRELPLHDREVWLKAIMSEFEQDFSHAKWREGYEQGKVEGMVECEKVKVKQFVADWYEENKDDFETKLFRFIESLSKPCEEDDPIEFIEWLIDDNTKPIQTLVNMHQFGYEVEKEKRYIVRVKGVEEDNAFLNYYAPRNEWFMDSSCDMKDIRAFHTRKELEEANFGWVFDCPGIEIEEVE